MPETFQRCAALAIAGANAAGTKEGRLLPPAPSPCAPGGGLERAFSV